MYSRTPLYGHPVNVDSLLCPWRKKALTFSLHSNRLIRTPHYYGQFALSLGKESAYIFSKFNPLNKDTPLMSSLNLIFFTIRKATANVRYSLSSRIPSYVIYNNT